MRRKEVNTMAIMRWERFGELNIRGRAGRIMGDLSVWPFRFVMFQGGMVPLDVYHTTDAVVVKATLPGVKPEELDVTITGDRLTIKGESKVEGDVKREDYLLHERRYGEFSRTVSLPGGLQTDKAEATFEDSVLTISIPKAEEVKPRTIRVKTRELAGAKTGGR
jgi:HSP20 family protein